MVFSEPGCRPLSYDIKARALSFYVKTKTSNNLAQKMMHFLFEHTKHRTFTSKYITFIENSLNDLGLTYIFNITLQETNVIKATIRRIKKTLQDQWLQALDSQLTTSGKTIFYRSITANLRSVPLYLEILPYQYRCLMTRFRLSNHHLPIETGRWRNIERPHRACRLCNLNQIGDEFHYRIFTSALSLIDK